MYAVTLRAPWGDAIAYLGKRVENRTWSPAPIHIGQRIAIHQGKRTDDDGARWIAEHFDSFDRPSWYQRAALFGTDRRGVIVATAVLDQVQHVEGMTVRDVWTHGPICWPLSDVRVMRRPIQARGRQGVWKLDDATEWEVKQGEIH